MLKVEQNAANIDDQVAFDETTLVEAARRGDQEAFTSLVEFYWAAIRRYLLRLSGEIELADDLTQETFYKAFLAIERIPKTATLQFRPWIYKIATNLAISANRGKAGKRLVSLDWLSDDHDPKIPAYILQDDQPTPLDQTLTLEASRQVVAVISQLPKDQTALLLLRFYHELSYEEISQVLGIRADAVRARLHRARAAFERAYTKYQHTEENRNER